MKTNIESPDGKVGQLFDPNEQANVDRINKLLSFIQDLSGDDPWIALGTTKMAYEYLMERFDARLVDLDEKGNKA